MKKKKKKKKRVHEVTIRLDFQIFFVNKFIKFVVRARGRKKKRKLRFKVVSFKNRASFSIVINVQLPFLSFMV